MWIIRFLKNWTLPVAMCTGVLAYFILTNLEVIAPYRPLIRQAAQGIQPILIALMLFITFCKIDPTKIRLHRWHLIVLTAQTGLFMLFAAILYLFPETEWRLFLESTMLCFVCPTATAAAVITSKLGGNATSITSYTIFINLATALLIPLVFPLAHPQEGISFLPSFVVILSRIFPMLIFPFLAAWGVRIVSPRLQQWIAKSHDLTFYMWAISLSIAIAIITGYMMQTRLSLFNLVVIASIALGSCMLQFGLGRWIGSRHHDTISGGQAFGQKNTIFAIWLAYTFLSPAASVVGGFYLVCHNMVNTYQLYKQRKSQTT